MSKKVYWGKTLRGKLALKKSNAEHRTSNSEWKARRAANTSMFSVRSSIFDVPRKCLLHFGTFFEVTIMNAKPIALAVLFLSGILNATADDAGMAAPGLTRLVIHADQGKSTISRNIYGQ